MKVLFVSIVPDFVKTYSLSFLILRSYILAKGIDADINMKLSTCEDGERVILDEILSEQFDIIGFSAHMWNYRTIRNLAKRIKEIRKETFIIAGGPEITYSKENVIEQNPCFDAVVKGEGEEPLYRILEKIRAGSFDFKDIPGVMYKDKENDRIIDNSPEKFNLENQNYRLNLDRLDDNDMESIYYETSRGCAFRCRFCVWLFLGKIKKYPMEKVTADLERIFQLPKLKWFGFADSDLFLDKKRGFQILKLINDLNKKRLKDNLPQALPHFELNIESLTDEIIDELVKCTKDKSIDDLLGIGLQTLNPHALKLINRKFNLETFVERYKKMKEKGITILIELIHGLPGDNLESFKETIDYLISKLNVEHFISCNYQVIPGSYFYQHADEYGLVHEPASPYRLLSSDSFPEEEMHEANKLAYYMEIIYFSVVRIRKMVDQKFKSNKIEVYEKIADHFYNKFRDTFTPQSRVELVWADVFKARQPELYYVRRDMIRDAKEIIESFPKTSKQYIEA